VTTTVIPVAAGEPVDLVDDSGLARGTDYSLQIGTGTGSGEALYIEAATAPTARIGHPVTAAAPLPVTIPSDAAVGAYLIAHSPTVVVATVVS